MNTIVFHGMKDPVCEGPTVDRAHLKTTNDKRLTTP